MKVCGRTSASKPPSAAHLLRTKSFADLSAVLVRARDAKHVGHDTPSSNGRDVLAREAVACLQPRDASTKRKGVRARAANLPFRQKLQMEKPHTRLHFLLENATHPKTRE